MGVGSRCVGFAPNFGGGATEKNKFSKRTTFKIIGVLASQIFRCLPKTVVMK